MKLKLVVVDLELSKRAKRIAVAALVPVLVIAGGAIAYANVPHSFKDGDVLNAADLNGNFDALDQRITKLEAAAASEPDCPRGYTKDAAPPNSANPSSVLCKKGVDEVVKVGAGAAAFWIDRYEASV